MLSQLTNSESLYYRYSHRVLIYTNMVFFVQVRLWLCLVAIVTAIAVYPMGARWMRGDFAQYPTHQDDITAAIDWVLQSFPCVFC